MGWWETGQVKILTSKPSIKTTDIKFLNYHAERKGRKEKNTENIILPVLG